MPEGQAGASSEIKISETKMRAALAAWREWEDSNEPDVRVFIRDLFSIALGVDASSVMQKTR